MAIDTPSGELGSRAPDFELRGVDGQMHRLVDVKGRDGTVIVFMCNHCPYVKAIIDLIIRDAVDLAEIGIKLVAICANDAASHPADSFPEMRAWSQAKRFPFPYLHDESQAVAKAYGAVCTPDFFGYDAGLHLRYRGRLDASRTTLVANARRELFEAMRQISATGEGPAEQHASMGCSIKWRAE